MTPPARRPERPDRARLVRALERCATRDARRAVLVRAGEACDEALVETLAERFGEVSRRDLARASRLVDAARLAAARIGSSGARAHAARLAGLAAHHEGRSAEAIRRLETAAKLFRAAGEPLSEGDVQRALVHVATLAGRPEVARRALRRARAAYRRAGGADPWRRAGLLVNVGNFHHARDEHRAALAAYDEALKIYRRGGHADREARTLYNRANILAALDRIDEARADLETSGRTFRRRRERALAVQADYALAGLDLLEGRLDDALERLEAVRGRHAELGDAWGVAHADLDAAEALLRLNRLGEADERARRAEPFFRRAGHHVERAACLAVRAAAALGRGEAAAAARLYRRAAELDRRAGNPVAAALMEVGRAGAERARGRAAEALASARRAATLFARRGLRSRTARALTVVAEAALDADRPETARRAARRAREIARRLGSVRLEFPPTLVLAELERRAGRRRAELRWLERAEQAVESMRAGVTSEESRLAFLLDKSVVYERLILNRLDEGTAESAREALAFSERGKARALLERLRGLPAPPSRADRTLLARLEQLERRLSVAEERLEGGASGPAGVRAATLGRLSDERAHLLGRLARRRPLDALARGGPPPPVDRLLAALRPDETVLEYTAAGDKLHLFVARHDGVVALPGIAPLSEVESALARLRFLLGKEVLGEEHQRRYGEFVARACRARLAELHALLVGPAEEHLAGDHLRIVPHGVLHGLPFHALEADGRPLIDRFAISYAPSLASAVLLERSARRAGAAAPLILGAADAAAPEIDAEVAAVAEVLPGAEVLRGRDAGRRALYASEASPPVLHVACHAFFAERDGACAALRLGDAWVSLAEIYGLNGTADLVVLSGCQTGRGAVHSGDEWVGLVRGFLQAGARTVVAALWEIHDRTAASMMADFYAGLARGLAAGPALAETQRAFCRTTGHPLRWAPFFLVGDPRFALTEGTRRRAESGRTAR
ncbi:MAG: CHAT domain-containing protein [Acidobacteria bacterium]|nr:MAG: CHAT domain-containing protein [Acidobacteriota bacterium]